MLEKRKYTLDLWKMIAAILIVGHHASSIGQKGDYFFHGGYIYTEFFFMISGFYMTKALQENKVKDSWDYAKKTWKHLFPYTTIVIVIHYLVTGLLSSSIKECLKIFMKMPLEIFLLCHLRILNAELGQLWYVAAMLVMMPIICWIFKKDRQLFKVIMLLIPLIWYGYCYTVWGQLGHRGVFIDLIRASTNLLLGGSAYFIVQEVNNKELNKYKAAITLIGHLSFIIPIIFTYYYYWTQYDFYCIFFFFISLVIVQLDFFIDIRCRWLAYFADLSMSLYIVHIPIGKLVQKFFAEEGVIQKYVMYYVGSLLYAILLLKLIKIIKSYILKKINS